jgi:hypothetical protein
MVKQNQSGTQTLVKWQANIDPDQDVAFINRMSTEGWKVVNITYGSKFTFVPCQPGEYLCQAAFTLKNSGAWDSQKYKQLSELLVQGGAEIVEQSTTLGNKFGIYAIRRAELGPFEINTDIDSKIAEYKQRMNYHLTIAIPFFILGATLTTLGITGDNPELSIFAGVEMLVALLLGYPAYRYERIIGRLKTERDISEV